MERTEATWLTVDEFLAAYQPPEPVGALHGTVLKRFDLASDILASGGTGPLMELVDGLTCPRGCA